MGICLHRERPDRNLRCIPALRPASMRETWIHLLGRPSQDDLERSDSPAGKGFAVIQSLHDRFRGFLRFRIERTPPRRGPKPAIGAYVVCGELRMTIQAGVTDELWEWLMEQGWRELRYAPDRRHYLVVPAPCVTRLIDAPEEQRPIALSVAVSHASLRPIIGDPNALPSYLVRH